jgi:predicted nucleic acid-binding protein
VAPELFIDTSAWFALAKRPLQEGDDESRVQAAMREGLKSGVRPVTTNLVVAESHVLMQRRLGRRPALTFLREVYRQAITIVRSDAALEAAAQEDWIEVFEDQDFSFTDAVSFAVMSERRIKQALTLDSHFKAAGFQVLPD